MLKNITFRTQLLGGVSEFCTESMLKTFANPIHLVELIVLLARYKEEGQSLCPKVYVTNDIQRIRSMLPDSESISIGRCQIDIQSMKIALKKCAPLANSGWMIYLNENGPEVEYGLFKGSSNPISVLVDDVILTPADSFYVVKAFQVADDCVEVRSNCNGFHYVFLNHRKEDSTPPLKYLDDLVDAITSNLEDADQGPTKSFLRRLLFESLRLSHGCIIAVSGMKKPPKFLSEDAVILKEPIDFAKLVQLLRSKSIDQSYLESKGHLLKGMLNSDGIILFDSNSRLLGYNCFVKVQNKDQIIGGARKRAFAAVKSKIGKGVSAVFMQSQDGWTDFIGEQ